MRDAGGTRELMSARAGTGPAPAPARGQAPGWIGPADTGNGSAGGASLPQGVPAQPPHPHSSGSGTRAILGGAMLGT